MNTIENKIRYLYDIGKWVGYRKMGNDLPHFVRRNVRSSDRTHQCERSEHHTSLKYGVLKEESPYKTSPPFSHDIFLQNINNIHYFCVLQLYITTKIGILSQYTIIQYNETLFNCIFV